MSSTYMLALRIFIRLFIGSIFLSSGLSKYIHLSRFKQGIQEYQLFPARFASRLTFLSALLIPAVELLCGLGLVAGIALIPLSILASLLLLIFCGAVIANLLRGRIDLSCHCAGALGEHRISWWLVGRNLFFVSCLSILLVTPVDVLSVDAVIQHANPPGGAIWLDTVLPVFIVVMIALALLFLLSYARDLLRL